MKTRFLIIIGIIIAIAVSITSISVVYNQEIKLVTGMMQSDERPEPVIETVFDLSQITTLEPNSAEFFYYPHPEDTENRDYHQLFMIIRLPEWLGGNATDMSAYRVFSAQSVDDQCVVKYWPDEGRQRIENPCRGGFYRIHDGAMTVTFGSVPGNPPVALPYLELSADENGFLFIEPPSFTTTENGVIGVGREITYSEIVDGTKFYVDAFEKAFPEYPQFPLYFSSMTLAEISATNYGVSALYSEFRPASQNITIKVIKCNCDSIRGHYPDDVIETIDGTVIVINEGNYNSSIKFAKNGFEYEIVGRDIDQMKRGITLTLLK